LRYQLGCVLLLRQIFGCPGSLLGIWMDEFDAGAGTLGYLGVPSIPRQLNASTGAYVAPSGNTAAANALGKGIYTIIFPGGVGYLYPAGNKDVTTGSTVNLVNTDLQNGGGHYIKYVKTPSGSQPPGITYPGGQAFSGLSIQPRDFIITLP
jgi:hypothetical protein